MIDERRLGKSLTEEQKKLVRDNVGLVAVHLRRFVKNLGTPKRDREREDLFQEGCLGLIQAAVRFQAERGIPFAAFALPRIHNAVSRALHTRFTTLYVPPRRRRKGGGPEDRGDDRPRQRGPKMFSLPDASSRPAASRHDPDGGDETRETIGDRIRKKYERAVRSAGASVCSRASARGDRHELVRMLTEEKFLIPQKESRKPLRQIARETASSYARVAQCDKRLSETVRATLESDPEFVELKRLARTDPQGHQTPVDSVLDHKLLELSSDAFVHRVKGLEASDRARLMETLLGVAPGSWEIWLRGIFTELPEETRERILNQATCESARV